MGAQSHHKRKFFPKLVKNKNIKSWAMCFSVPKLIWITSLSATPVTQKMLPHDSHKNFLGVSCGLFSFPFLLTGQEVGVEKEPTIFINIFNAKRKSEFFPLKKKVWSRQIFADRCSKTCGLVCHFVGLSLHYAIRFSIPYNFIFNGFVNLGL